MNNLKKQLIESFKNLDFNSLNELLDDHKSYMEVSKELFLAKLKENFDDPIVPYNEVIEGICGSCNNGCVAYKFTSPDLPSLNLFFKEENEDITDVYLCNNLNVTHQSKLNENIYFRFYEDEKINFKPTSEYLLIQQKVNNAVEEFNLFYEKEYTLLKDIAIWYEEHKYLINELNLNSPFDEMEYKIYVHIDSIFYQVECLMHNFEKNNLAKIALNEVNLSDNDSIMRWLSKYRDLNFYSLKKMDNWKISGLILLECNPDLIVDCKICLESFIFEDTYRTLHEKNNSLDNV